MKYVLIFFCLSFFSKEALSQHYKVVLPKNAHKYIGREIIVKGTLCSFGNSSYGQFAWYYLGADTSHVQIKIIFQGEIYNRMTNSISDGKKTLKDYIGKIVQIRGIVKGGKETYIEATDGLTLK